MYLESIGIWSSTEETCNTENPVVRDELWERYYSGNEEEYEDEEEDVANRYIYVEIDARQLSAEELQRFSDEIDDFSVTEYIDEENEPTGEYEITGWVTSREFDEIWEVLNKYDVKVVEKK